MPIRESNNAKKEAITAIVFIFLGVVLLLIGDFTVAVLNFVVAAYSAQLWSAKNRLQKIQENPSDEISTKEESVSDAFGAMLRTAFKDLRATRRKLALVSFGLSILFFSWTNLTFVTVSDTGHEFLGALVFLDAGLYWSLGFAIRTYIRRRIAAAALGVSMLNWIVTVQIQSPDAVPTPAWALAVGAVILFPTIGVFITLAIVSFIDDEPEQIRESRP